MIYDALLVPWTIQCHLNALLLPQMTTCLLNGIALLDVGLLEGHLVERKE